MISHGRGDAERRRSGRNKGVHGLHRLRDYTGEERVGAICNARSPAGVRHAQQRRAASPSQRAKLLPRLLCPLLPFVQSCYLYDLWTSSLLLSVSEAHLRLSVSHLVASTDQDLLGNGGTTCRRFSIRMRPMTEPSVSVIIPAEANSSATAPTPRFASRPIRISRSSSWTTAPPTTRGRPSRA